MSTRIVIAGLLCALFGLSGATSAAVSNGGFESGNLSGWTLAGQGSAQGAGVGVTPTEGSFQAYLETTGNFTALAPAVVSSLGVPGSAILGLGAGTPTNGTGISQDITVAAGDTLSFDWNFMTDELNESATYNDFGFFTVDSSAYLLASRNSSTFNTVAPPAGFDGVVGWSTYTYTFASAGTYKIGFGVFNVGDTGHNSVLLVDAVGVPEPVQISTLLALGTMLPLSRLRRVPSRNIAR